MSNEGNKYDFENILGPIGYQVQKGEEQFRLASRHNNSTIIMITKNFTKTQSGLLQGRM